jgi:hypothetical protein
MNNIYSYTTIVHNMVLTFKDISSKNKLQIKKINL